MFRVSDWYTSLACFTFPTVFIGLRVDEIAALVDGDASGMVQCLLRLLRFLGQVKDAALLAQEFSMFWRHGDQFAVTAFNQRESFLKASRVSDHDSQRPAKCMVSGKANGFTDGN